MSDPLSDLPPDLSSDSTIPSGDDFCIICFESEANCSLKCRHTFHSNCILSWFRVQKSCPMCRARVATQNIKPFGSPETAVALARETWTILSSFLLLILKASGFQSDSSHLLRLRTQETEIQAEMDSLDREESAIRFNELKWHILQVRCNIALLRPKIREFYRLRRALFESCLRFLNAIPDRTPEDPPEAFSLVPEHREPARSLLQRLRDGSAHELNQFET